MKNRLQEGVCPYVIVVPERQTYERVLIKGTPPVKLPNKQNHTRERGRNKTNQETILAVSKKKNKSNTAQRETYRHTGMTTTTKTKRKPWETILPTMIGIPVALGRLILQVKEVVPTDGRTIMKTTRRTLEEMRLSPQDRFHL
eukprot:scaffold13709_cov54-Cylindrotheca_fusiformis.AAC.4